MEHSPDAAKGTAKEKVWDPHPPWKDIAPTLKTPKTRDLWEREKKSKKKIFHETKYFGLGSLRGRTAHKDLGFVFVAPRERGGKNERSRGAQKFCRFWHD